MAAKRKQSNEKMVAYAAMFVSLCTLLVYFYQARIMQSQQHASVWPYVEWIRSFNEEEGFYLSVSNKGVGPAIVKQELILLDGEELDGAETLLEKVLGDTVFSYSYSTINRRVMAPGEQIKRFWIHDAWAAEAFDSLIRQHDFRYEICYCSIYGDCWRTSGITVEEDGCQ